MPCNDSERGAVTELLTVRRIAKGPRQRAPWAAHKVDVGDVVDLVYVHPRYSDMRRGKVTRRYLMGTVEVRFTEPVRRVRAVLPGAEGSSDA